MSTFRNELKLMSTFRDELKLGSALSKEPASGLELGVGMRQSAGHALSARDLLMKKFAVIVQGQNFLIQDKEDKFPSLREFYIHAYPEAETAEVAEGLALGLVRDLLKERKMVRNAPENVPVLLIDECVEVAEWPECTRPLSGFVFIEAAKKG
jgi:hypothetical protein